MIRKLARSINTGIRRVLTPISRWWNLENWTAASELFLKLLSVVTLIVAVEFFSLKPKIEWNVKYLDKFEYRKFQEYYANAGREMPDIVETAITRFFYSLDYHGQTGVIVRDELTLAKSSVPEDQFVFNLGEYIPAGDEKDFAWSAITNEAVTIGKITITNTGNAPATKIQILPPPEFKLTNSAPQVFDLAPGESITVWIDAGKKYDFELEYLWGDTPGEAPNIIVTWDTSFGVVNKKLFMTLGSVALLIWISVVARDIWFSEETTEDNSISESTEAPTKIEEQI